VRARCRSADGRLLALDRDTPDRRVLGVERVDVSHVGPRAVTATQQARRQ
jgi:hypothetical protein